MEHNAPSGGVTKSSDIPRIRENGCALEVGPYIERPGLDQRLLKAGADVAAVRRMLASTGAVMSS